MGQQGKINPTQENFSVQIGDAFIGFRPKPTWKCSANEALFWVSSPSIFHIGNCRRCAAKDEALNCSESRTHIDTENYMKSSWNNTLSSWLAVWKMLVALFYFHCTVDPLERDLIQNLLFHFLYFQVVSRECVHSHVVHWNVRKEREGSTKTKQTIMQNESAVDEGSGSLVV